MNLLSQIESILFVASKPLSAKDISKAVKEKETEVRTVLEDLQVKYNGDASGIHVLIEGDKYQMSTNPDNLEVVDLFIKDEAAGELTRAQLETLTVIAYRGPVTRPELEQIRGVNCSLILRNLLIRGLIEEQDGENKLLPVFTLSMEAMRHLGIKTTNELPDYDKLHAHEYVVNVLDQEKK